MAFTTVRGSGSAPDSFLGTAGVDAILLQNQAEPAFLSARAGDDQVTVSSYQQLVSAQTLYGGQGNDRLTILNQTNFSLSFIAQNEGDDTVILAGLTSSTVQGNQGNDTITTTGLINSVVVNSNQGNDSLNVNGGVAGGHVLGGSGFDNLTINNGLSSSTIQGNEDDDILIIAAGQIVANATVNGNQGNDTLTLNAITAFTNATLFGGTGNDTINGEATAVSISIQGDDGNDLILSGAGNDTLIDLNGNNEMRGRAGADTIMSGWGVDTIFGNEGNDTIASGSGNDLIQSGQDNDTVSAADGNDTINGGSTGSDLLSGESGNDRLVGDSQADSLSGGTGADLFDQTNGSTDVNIAANTVVANNNTLSNGDILQVAADILTDFATAEGDKVEKTVAGLPVIATGAANQVNAANLLMLVRGNYSNGAFIVNLNGGADALFFQSSAAAANATAFTGTAATLFSGQGANITTLAANGFLN